MPDLTLYAESRWVSPWVFHAMVALEEKNLPYALATVPLPIPPEQRDELAGKALVGKVPILVHGDAWITESLAISEYLAERFPAPAHPRLFPADLVERARARQLMLLLRTSFAALREERPTSSVFGRPTNRALSDQAKADAAELVRIATVLVKPGTASMFERWCIADADLTLALMRLVANEDPVPDDVVTYVIGNWERRSVRRFMAHVPTTH
ncbi:MAG TPA: glutathione transferase [Kofleriaceae bacterium]|nr:glutathione transferase [Kofleriaceae bacterium]